MIKEWVMMSMAHGKYDSCLDRILYIKRFDIPYYRYRESMELYLDL